ncbi:class I SAM-dependent methyltransferase [bacterium]|nr:class I SAM-dependent methyltransferase [bacterium]
MSQTPAGYFFETQTHCDMCGHSTEKASVIGHRASRTTGFFPRRARGVIVPVLRCNNCGLYFSDPMPVPMDISQHYGVDPVDYWPESLNYFVEDPGYFSGEIAVAKRLLNFQPGMRSLDIGSGIGKSLRAMTRAGFEPFGIEPSEKFRQYATEKNGIPASSIQAAQVETAVFEENFFDFITFGAVLEHVYHPSQCMNIALKWLKPGGILHVEVPSPDWLIARLINLVYRLQGTTFVTNISPMHVPYHLYEFTVPSFQAFARRSGCEIAHHEFFVCAQYHVPKFLQGLLRSIMSRTNTGMQLSMYLRKTG